MRKWSIMSASRLGSVEGPELELEGGANAHPSEVAENRKTVCLGTALAQVGTPWTSVKFNKTYRTYPHL